MSSGEDIQTQAAITANKLASAAVGFAIAAFLIAYLQLFLGNITSGNALWKTNQAAIGVLAFFRSWRPSLRRIKILYPKISLQPEDLLQAAQASKGNQKSSTLMSSFWRWLTPHLEYSHDRPRATWAQIIQAFNITDASHLVEDYLDSDTIPSGIDVPVQRARLFDLGRLALYLGCDAIDLDVGTRELHAQGEICGMTTDRLPTFGKAVHFEGDTSTLALMNVGSHRLDTAMIMDCMCLGQFLLSIPVEGMKEFRIHPDILCLSLMQRSSASEYYAACQSVWPFNSIELDHLTGSFADEAEALASYKSTENPWMRNPYKENGLAKWQGVTRFIRPSIMIIATKCVIPGAFIGYPRVLFLNELISWCSKEAQQIYQLLPKSEIISSSSQAPTTMQRLALDPKFFMYHDQVRMPFLGRKPAYSWLTTRLQEEYNGLPDDIKDSLSSSRPHLLSVYNVQVVIIPWTLALFKEYNPSEWARNFQTRCQSTSKPYTSPCRLLWMQLILLDISIRLQIKRNPDRLDGSCFPMKELQDLDVKTPLNSIMIAEGPEIVKAITYSQINSNCQPSGNCSPTTVPCIPRTLNYGINFNNRKQPDCPKYQPWDLHRSLLDNCSFYDDMNAEDASNEYNRLAIMLKLRALFLIAFLMVGPDSSQVYEARNSHAQVPII